MSYKSRLELVVEHVESLKGGAYKRISFDQIREIAREILEGHQFISVSFKAEDPFLRARQFNSLNESKKSVTSVEDMLSQKPSMATNYGRCNWPENPMLYTSINLDTAFSECRALTDQFICVGHIASNKNIPAVVVGEADRYRRTGQTLTEKAKPLAKKIIDDIDMPSWIVDAFLNELLTMPCTHPSHYKLTSAFCAEILNPPNMIRSAKLQPELNLAPLDLEDRELVDAICYSSVPNSGGLNFAFKPSVYEKYLELKKCEIWKVTRDYGYGIYEKEKITETDEFNGGKINWK